jgi:hypothetical protein
MTYVMGEPCVDVVDRAYVEESAFTADNARFFAEPRPRRDAPLGSPGGGAKLGRLGVDTGLVACCSRQAG